MVTGLLMLMTILLIGFAPVAWLFSQSTESLGWMGFLHLLFWLIATAFGVRFSTRRLPTRTLAPARDWRPGSSFLFL